MAGDPRALIAANNMEIRRLTHLTERLGRPTLDAYIDKLIEDSELRFRNERQDLPQRTVEVEGCLDGEGTKDEPIHLRARVTVDGRNVTFDFTGTDDQRPAPLN